MATPIPKHRLDALMSMPLCNHAWLSEPGRTYEDLSEHPNWAYHAARFQGADVARLQAIVIAHGSPELRRKFAAKIAGADKAALLSGL